MQTWASQFPFSFVPPLLPEEKNTKQLAERHTIQDDPGEPVPEKNT